MRKVVAVLGITTFALAGCGVEPPHENDSRFTDVKINGTRCILFTPGVSSDGTVMQCDFAGYIPQGPPIDNPELSPPLTEETPTEPTP